MLSKLKDRKVKVVLKDGDKIKAYRGIVTDIDNIFFKLQLKDGSIMFFNKEDIRKIRLEKE